MENKKTSILIYLTDGFDRFTPNNHIYTAIIRDLVAAGFKVKLIESKFRNQDLTSGDPHSNMLDLEADNFQRNYVMTKKILKHRFIARYIEGVMYTKRSRKLFRGLAKDVDMVLIGSCPTSYFQIRMARKNYKGPLIYNIQDMFPGSTIAVGAMPNKLMQRFFFWLQKKAYKRIDHFTVISEDMMTKLVSQNVPEDKITVIYNWFDDTYTKEISWDDNNFVKKYKLDKNKFYVQYAGGMGYVFDYMAIINAAEKLKDYKNIEFQMVGQGSLLDSFIKEKNQRELQNITFLPLQPQDTVAHVYSAASVELIPLVRDLIGNSVPSKAGQLMACKRPIINSVDEDSYYFKIFPENNIGISVSNLNHDGLVDAILKLYNNPDLAVQMGLNGFKYGREIYSRTYNTNKYINLCNRIKNETK